MSSRVLYHVTHKDNCDGIARRGIDPALSKGRLACAWFTTFTNLFWAIAHVSIRLKCPVADLRVVTVKISERQLTKTQFKKVWRTSAISYPIEILWVEDYLYGK